MHELLSSLRASAVQSAAFWDECFRMTVEPDARPLIAHVIFRRLVRATPGLDLFARLRYRGSIAIPCDVSRYWEVEAAVAACHTAFGRLDVLIGNAGVIDPITSLSTADPDSWGHAIDVNLKGVFNGMRAALPGMLAQGSGTIITISSGAAHNALDGWSAYCASKAGAAMLTQSADLENRDKGIRVMGLSPGTVATDMQREIKKSGVNAVSQLDWSDHIPPEWPAKALLWMCSAAADDFAGQEISLRDEDIRKRAGLT